MKAFICVLLVIFASFRSLEAQDKINRINILDIRIPFWGAYTFKIHGLQTGKRYLAFDPSTKTLLLSEVQDRNTLWYPALYGHSDLLVLVPIAIRNSCRDYSTCGLTIQRERLCLYSVFMDPFCVNSRTKVTISFGTRTTPGDGRSTYWAVIDNEDGTLSLRIVNRAGGSPADRKNPFTEPSYFYADPETGIFQFVDNLQESTKWYYLEVDQRKFK